MELRRIEEEGERTRDEAKERIQQQWRDPIPFFKPLPASFLGFAPRGIARGVWVLKPILGDTYMGVMHTSD